MHRFQAIVLDMDDTLYLERDYVRSGFRAVGELAQETFGIADLSDDLWALFLAGTRGNTFDIALEHRGVRATTKDLGDLVACYRSHKPQIELLADAKALLERVPSGRLGLITDGPATSQRQKVTALGLESLIDTVVLTSEFGEGLPKPDSASFLHVARALNADNSECVYIGDNPKKDFIAPRALGWATVRIRRPNSLHWDLPSGPDVDIEVSDLSGISVA